MRAIASGRVTQAGAWGLDANADVAPFTLGPLAAQDGARVLSWNRTRCEKESAMKRSVVLVAVAVAALGVSDHGSPSHRRGHFRNRRA